MTRMFAFFLVLFGLAAPALSQPMAGDYGGACLPDRPRCAGSVCDPALDLCVACGMPGEPACEDGSSGPSCYLSRDGNQPVRMGDGGVYCVQSSDDPLADCGHVGYASCQGYGLPRCRFGVFMPPMQAGDPGLCLECGNYGQPCCEGTDLECDYGTCQGGLCLPQAAVGGTGGAGGSSGVMPNRYGGNTTAGGSTPSPAPPAPPPTQVTAHPCLDPGQKVTRWFTSYNWMGIGPTASMKGDIVCDLYGSAGYGEFSRSGVTIYTCDRDGDVLKNCRQTRFDKVLEVKHKQGYSEIHFQTPNGNKYWWTFKQ